MKYRNNYFDFLRGIAIIMVIGIHTFPSIHDMNDISDWVIIFIRQILNCAVPLFLAISGYFIAQKDLDTLSNKFSFWKKQIPAIYIPCLVFSFGWFFLYIANRGVNSILIGLANLIVCGFSVYYFIILMIQLYLITPFLLKINKKMGGKGIIATSLISTSYILILSYMMYVEGMSFALVTYAGPFACWIVFYMLGIWHSTNPRKNNLKLAIILITIGYIGSIIECYIYFPIHGTGLGIKLSSFIFSAGIIILLFSKQMENLFSLNKLTQIILYIGEISFGIYFLHMYVISLLNQFNLLDNWMINWVITLLVTSILIIITKLILPKNFAIKYLGFR